MSSGSFECHRQPTFGLTRIRKAWPWVNMRCKGASGGEGSQLQVQVGDQVPGYGKITAIQQRGATWVVQTAAGAIQ